MASIILIIETVNDISTDYVEADGVYFAVKKGDPSQEQILRYFNGHPRSLCNVEYSEETKKGYFADLDFSFKEGEEFTIELCYLTQGEWGADEVYKSYLLNSTEESKE